MATSTPISISPQTATSIIWAADCGASAIEIAAIEKTIKIQIIVSF